MGDNEIYAIETIGNGNNQYDPLELSVEDIRVNVTRTTDGREGTAKRRRTIYGDDINDYIGIGPPENKDEKYDVVIVVSGAPAPEFVRNAPESQVDVTIEVQLGEESEQWVTECPGCDRDLHDTFEDGECTACGFTFLQENRPDLQD